jgi:streptogramin lyase
MKTLSAKVKTLSSKVATLWVATLLAACGGGGGGGGGGPAPIPSAPIPTPTQTLTPNNGMQKVAISLVVPINSGTNGAKRPAYISASAMGAGIVVTQGATTVNATLDLSPSSSACTGSGSARTCMTSVTVPIGTDVFTVTIYNQAPVNNVIPNGAAILGVGTSSVNVIAGSTTSVPVFVGGEIAHLGATLPSGSLPANGQPQNAVLVIAPTDFGNNPITAGQNDPYANPITVALTESGGSGLATLSLNGGAASTSVLITKSSDSVTLNYAGAGTPGYSFTITLSASGVSAQSSTIAPLIAEVNGSTLTSVSLNGNAVGALQLGFGEAGSSRTYMANLTGCTNVATIGAVSGSGASATLPVTGGNTPSASGCTLTISDGSVSLVLPVTNTPIGATVTVAGTTITEYTGYNRPFGITKGPDGNIWFTDQGNDTVNALNPSNASLVYNYAVPGSDLWDITTGSDGALWMADQNLEGVDRLTTAGILTPYAMPSGGSPRAITGDTTGQFWIGDASNGVMTLSAGGAFATVLNTGQLSGAPFSVVQGPDGAIWWGEAGGMVGRYNPVDTSFTETPVPGATNVNFVAVGPDNAIWFTATGGSSMVGRIAMNGDGPFTPTTYTTGTQLAGITAGADNAMWFLDAGAGTVNAISLTSHAISTFPIPSGASASPYEIVRGPDGSLWFTEQNHAIGHVIP